MQRKSLPISGYKVFNSCEQCLNTFILWGQADTKANKALKATPTNSTDILHFPSHYVKDTYWLHFIHILFMAAHQGGIDMADTIERRACQLAVYIIETGATVRNAAKHFGISKSTVHKDLTQRLPMYNNGLYKQVRCILESNKAQRHIRGGIATKQKYQCKQQLK